MLVENDRGSVVESRHVVHVAVVDAAGRLVATAGDPDLVTFWRSAAKPFQALPLVEDGVVEQFKLTRQDLALACASHSSEPAQVSLVREFLQRIGCSERERGEGTAEFAGADAAERASGTEPVGRQVLMRRGVSWLRAWALARITSGSKPAARAASAASR